MQAINKYCKTDDNYLQLSNKQKLNSDNVNVSNTNNNLLHGELSQIIHYFDKMNLSEIEPTTQNINKSIFEEELSIVVDELIDLIFKEVNEGRKGIRKKRFFDYINNNQISSQEIYK